MFCVYLVYYVIFRTASGWSLIAVTVWFERQLYSYAVWPTSPPDYTLVPFSEKFGLIYNVITEICIGLQLLANFWVVWHHARGLRFWFQVSSCTNISCLSENYPFVFHILWEVGVIITISLNVRFFVCGQLQGGLRVC